MPGDGGTARHVEVERKFDVDDATPLPSFTGIATVAAVSSLRLTAVYFDTPAHDLAARRITLRRRSGDTGSTGENWHLKLPAGPDTRTELHAPAGPAGEGVPTELLDTVLAVVRDQPVLPVAQIATCRDVRVLHGADGSVLAEFCDDRVTASAGESPVQHWREWEVELVDPATVADPGATEALLNLLGTRLFDAGAVRAGYGSKLARVLGPAPAETRGGADPIHRAVSELVDRLLVWDRAVRADADDAVHQMRVTIRKIRSLLQVSAESFGVDGDSPVLDGLRWLAGVLGTARDAEVLAQRYRTELDRLSPQLIRGRAKQRLVGTAMRHYRDGWQRSLAALRSPRYFRLLDDLEALVASSAASGPVADATAPRTVAAAYRRLTKAARAAARADADHNDALHRIRKAAKRLRYTAAAAGEPEVAARTEVIQTLLGDHQDSVVSRAHLLAESDAANAAGEDTFTYGLLYQRESDLADRCRAQLDGALADLADVVGQAAGPDR